MVIFHLTCEFSGVILMIGRPKMGFNLSDSLGVLFLQIKMKLVVSDHLKNMLVKLDHFPTGRVKRQIFETTKNSPMRFNVRWPSNAICSSPERLAATPRCKVTWWSIWHDVMVAWWILVVSNYITIHPWKLTCALKRDYFNRKYIFRPLILKGNVSFPRTKY